MLRKYYFTNCYSITATRNEMSFILYASDSIEWTTTIMLNQRITLFLN
ncbi:MAG: hypothetical protein ACXWV5_09500 [Flavitalea sp.]